MVVYCSRNFVSFNGYARSTCLRNQRRCERCERWRHAELRRHAERGHAVGAVEGSLSVGLGPHSCRHFALADRDTLNGPVSVETAPTGVIKTIQK